MPKREPMKRAKPKLKAEMQKILRAQMERADRWHAPRRSLARVTPLGKEK